MNESTADDYVELRIAETIHHIWERGKSIAKDLEDCKRMVRTVRGEADMRGCNGRKQLRCDPPSSVKARSQARIVLLQTQEEMGVTQFHVSSLSLYLPGGKPL
jgi:hypothetical protein